MVAAHSLLRPLPRGLPRCVAAGIHGSQSEIAFACCQAYAPTDDFNKYLHLEGEVRHLHGCSSPGTGREAASATVIDQMERFADSLRPLNMLGAEGAPGATQHPWCGE